MFASGRQVERVEQSVVCLHDRRVVHASCVGGDMAGRSGVEAAVEACRGTDKNEFVFHQESPQASPGPAQTVHTRTLCVCMQRTQHASARCTFLWKVVCMYVCTYVRMYLHMYICMRVRTPTYIVDLQPAHHRATHPPVWSSPATPCRLRAPSPSSHWPPRLVSSPHSPWLARDAHARRSTELARVARRKANVRRLSLLF